MDIFLAVFLLIGVVGLIGIVSAFKFVPQGHNWTVERFGRYTRTLVTGV